MKKVATKTVLSVEELNVDIGSLKILKDINFATCSGDVRAVLGPSGAGKTTLLNAIAGRQKISSGGIYLSGKPFNKRLRRQLGFETHQDPFFTSLTLWETLYFTAMVGLPENIPKEEKVRRLDEIIDILDIRQCTNTVVGGPLQKGLSGGEKRRLSIGCVLLADPDIIILDEPTSGLDSSTAFMLVKQLKNIADEYNKTVIVTVHQPPSKVYHLFDSLLLMANGQVVYDGVAHKKPIDFFDSAGYKCDPLYNPAEFMLDVLNEGKTTVDVLISRRSILEQTVTEHDKTKRNHSQGHLSNTENMITNSSSTLVTTRDDEVCETCLERWPTGFCMQFRMLTWRNFKQSKQKFLYVNSVVQSILMAVVAGALFFQISGNLEVFRDRMGLCVRQVLFVVLYILQIYFCVVAWSVSPATQAALTFQPELEIVTKEQASGIYRLSAYYAAKTASDLPLVIIVPGIFFTIAYWMAGLSGIGEFFISLIVILLSSGNAQGLGMLVGAIISDIKLAVVVTVGVSYFSILFSGFISQEIPTWLTWAKYVSYINYPVSAITIVTSRNLEPLPCNLTSSTIFTKCLQNGSDFVTRDDVLHEAGIDLPSSFYIGVLVGMFLAFRIFTYIALRIKKNR